MLVTELMQDACGRAYLGGLRSSGRFAFSIVGRRCADTGRAFAHEIGHNLGAHHDWYTTDEAGAFSYAKGFVSLSGRYLDIMAYFSRCRAANVACAQVLFFANPAMSHNGYTAGVPAGTSTACVSGDVSHLACDADVVQAFSQMAPLVARYRDSQSSLARRQILPGRSMLSESGRYRLTYQADGNLVLVDTQGDVRLWATDTAGISPGQVVMHGNLVMLDAAGAVVWASGTGGNPGAFLVVQDDGNVVIYRPDGQPVWAPR
jgi:hypothetical protein